MSSITDQATEIAEDTKQFIKDSVKFIKRCNKPEKKGIFTLWIIL